MTRPTRGLPIPQPDVLLRDPQVLERLERPERQESADLDTAHESTSLSLLPAASGTIPRPLNAARSPPARNSAATTGMTP